ncbi:hypothetical protein DDE83_009211 [Stemphylium lycopersici]|uniref:DDE-1 domain-containing protein n=1 Tax=Stemphylium lycopersici TaxID=183478 RepID=A0A364MR88_STELY|nr:hypothetical protein DDE83_009211 [Stemphylium lycopersici]
MELSCGVLKLDRRGFPPHVIDVRRMADALLAARGQEPPPPPVGKCWVSRFVNSQSKLQTKWNRKFHSQRARCEDPVAISAWFKLVEETRQAYGILDNNVYNFDETSFIIGVAATSKVVTSSDIYCIENKIITLCMPPYTSHLLQPLDVSCFSPLKRAYGHEIQELARQGVYHIDKVDFLTTYTQIRPAVFTEQNIQAGF